MLRAGQVVMLCAIALLTIGVVMVNSAGMSVSPIDPSAEAADEAGVTPKSIIFSRSTRYMLLALGAMFLAYRLPVRSIAERLRGRRVLSPAAELPALFLLVLLLVVVLSMVYWPVIGREVNGSHRWVRLPIPGFESIQPSEIAKWALVPVVAWYGARLASRTDRHGRPIVTRFWRGLIPGLAAVGIVSVLILIEDLGTGVLVGAVGVLLLIAAGARIWHFLLFVPPALAGIALAVWHSPYRIQRITAFLDPYADPQGSGYHMIQSMATVAGGGVFGRGLGHGLQKFGYLPEDQTDFLFAIICEELGLAGATLIFGLYAIMIWTGWSILRREREPMLKLLTLGVLATLGLQAVMNLVVVTGLGPTKGIALPLLSSGGTGWILTAASLGLLAAIDRTAPALVRAEVVADAEAGEDAPGPVEVPVRIRPPTSAAGAT